MLNLAQSLVVTFINVILSFVTFIKGPVLLVVGVTTLVAFLLASPAEAAVIQCNVSDCSMLS